MEEISEFDLTWGKWLESIPSSKVEHLTLIIRMLIEGLPLENIREITTWSLGCERRKSQEIKEMDDTDVTHHPEQAETEEFIGNTSRGQFVIKVLHRNGITSARLGQHAYDQDCKEQFPDGIYHPIFISRLHSIEYDNLMMSLMYGYFRPE